MKKKSRSAKPLSKKQQIEKMNGLLLDVDGWEEISNDDAISALSAKANISIGDGKHLTFATDSASGMIQQKVYNEPVPLGFREVPPSSIPLKGVVGKVIKHFAARNFFLGDQINGWFGQNCFVYKACSMPGDDAESCGYKFVPRGTKQKKLVEIINDKISTESFNIGDTLRTFECNKRMYGGAIMIPCFEEEIDMSVPLVDYGILKGKTFIGWTNIEPYYLTPHFEPGSRNITDPTYKHYLQPTHWGVMGSGDGMKMIHSSWIFFRRNIVTSRIYQPMYKYLGPSIPQMILERLYSAEVCANESSMLMRSKRSFVIEEDVRKLAANPTYAKKFLKSCALNANNWDVRVVPRNSNAKQMDSYLSECMPLTTAQYGILCAEIEIPAPKFMMAQLSGFANSGNYEIKLYAANVRKIVNNDLIPIMKQTAKIVTACENGVAENLGVEFGELDIPTVTEKAEIMYEEARAHKFEEEAKAFKRGLKGPGSHHDIGEIENS